MDEVAPGTTTLGRACDIEAGRGAPATEQELADCAKFEAVMAPVMRKLAASMRMTERKRSEMRHGMRIYRGLDRAEQIRWGHRKPAELVAYTRTARAGHRTLRSARSPRVHVRSSGAATRDGPGDEPPDPEPPGLNVIPLAAFRRELLHRLGRSA